MLEQRLRDHIDSAATPLTYAEITERPLEDSDVPPLAETEVGPVPVWDVDGSSSTGGEPRELSMALVTAVLVLVSLGVLIVSSLRSPSRPVASTGPLDNSYTDVESPRDTISAGATEQVDDLGSGPISSFEDCLGYLEVPNSSAISAKTGVDLELVIDGGEGDDRVALCAGVIEVRTRGAGVFPSFSSPAQLEALDGGVTEEEFEQAFERFVQCNERGGVSITRNEDGWTYEGGRQPFSPTVCGQWHLHVVEWSWRLAQQVAENPDGVARLQDEVQMVSLAVETRAQELGLAGLVEATDPERCQTTYEDRDWITTFDEMQQPLCVIVAENQDLDFWNKGFSTATVGWPGGGRELQSDSSFATGRIGDLFPSGTHEISVEPYGVVTIHVVPIGISPMATLAIRFTFALLNVPGIQGLNGTVFTEALGHQLEPVDTPQPANGCWHARVKGDPYSPVFAFLGDGTLEGSIFVGLNSGESC